MPKKHPESAPAAPLPHDTLKDAAARLRNILDQKTYTEKRTLKRYLSVLELKLERQARLKSRPPDQP
jgi:hypothetical protein